MAFDEKHPYFRSIVQHVVQSMAQAMFVQLIRSLSQNKVFEDEIIEDLINTNAQENLFGLILLAFFVPWNQLAFMFQSRHVTKMSYENCYWEIWINARLLLDDHMLYYATATMCVTCKKAKLSIRSIKSNKNTHKIRPQKQVI